MILDFSLEKLERLKARYSDVIESVVTENVDVPVIFVSAAKVLSFLSSLKTEEGFEFNFLADLTACDDNPPTEKISDYGLGVVPAEQKGEPRFHVIYNLLSMQNKDRIRVKVRLQEGEDCPTATGLWKAADWLEREVYDMYGIRFSGHPNMRRILMSESWQGHPQRKDYPIRRYQRDMRTITMEEAGLEG